MTQQTVNIDKGQTITISNLTFGDITVTLNDVGEYVVVSNGPSVALQQTTIDKGFKQEYSCNSKYIKQTAFNSLPVKNKSDLSLG
jgi:hypothetical protein